MQSWHDSLGLAARTEAKRPHPACGSQLLILNPILLDCRTQTEPSSKLKCTHRIRSPCGSKLTVVRTLQSRQLQGPAAACKHLLNKPLGEGPFSRPGTPKRGFLIRNTELLLLGEGVHMDWDPFSGWALVVGQHPVLLKACCWQGKLSAC